MNEDVVFSYSKVELFPKNHMTMPVLVGNRFRVAQPLCLIIVSYLAGPLWGAKMFEAWPVREADHVKNNKEKTR